MSYNNQSWQMLCSKEALFARAKLNSIIRDFFKKRNVLEVETPLLARSTVTDPFINSFEVQHSDSVDASDKYYLQTSPEFAMKKMLCSGVGSIYQICKAFRSEEIGRNHNIEFTMLEWYRIGFNLDDLITEMEELLVLVINSFQHADNKFLSDSIIQAEEKESSQIDLSSEHSIFAKSHSIQKSHSNSSISVKKFTYQELFLEYLNVDYNTVDIEFLKKLIKEKFQNSFDSIIYHKDFERYYNKDDLLMILLSNYIEPKLDKNQITFLYNYPATQAALARLDIEKSVTVAKRFEVYYRGFELANGYYELTQANEQRQRFINDLEKRKTQGLPCVTMDEKLILALESGLPDCSGVALGIDRLLMAVLNKDSIDDVLTFR